jgi:hypothetical protein
MDIKIDMVYLWVDGSDEKWLAKKNSELKKIGGVPDTAAGENRYFDNDELLFSLRSVEKFAPWVNHVFIVTDNQIPKWLNSDNPKVTIIDHTDIIPKTALPCFNSTVIELFIPCIPNLSEHFLYANDDMLFMSKVKPSYFFTQDGIPIIRANNKAKVKRKYKDLFPAGQKFKTLWESGHIHDCIKLNSMKLLYDLIGDYNYSWQETHNIDPYRKSDMLRVMDMPPVKEGLENTIKSRFRNERDLHRTLFHHFGFAKLGYKLVGMDFITMLSQYLTLRFRDRPAYAVNLKTHIYRHPFRRKLMCIGDVGNAEFRKSNHDFFMKMFPNKSGFES